MRKKITLRIFLISCRKVLLKCHPFSGIQTILHNWFSHYFCATIHFLYNCWKPVFEICIIGKICCKKYMSIACFFCKRFSLTSLNQHKKQLKMSLDTTKENCLSQRSTLYLLLPQTSSCSDKVQDREYSELFFFSVRVVSFFTVYFPC